MNWALECSGDDIKVQIMLAIKNKQLGTDRTCLGSPSPHSPGAPITVGSGTWASSLLSRNLRTPVSGMLHPWFINKASATTGGHGPRKTFISFSKCTIQTVKWVSAHHWDFSQSLLPTTAVPFLLWASAAADCAEGAEMQPLAGFVCVASTCILSKPFQLFILSPFQRELSSRWEDWESEVLQVSLLRECITNALQWTFWDPRHLLLMRVISISNFSSLPLANLQQSHPRKDWAMILFMWAKMHLFSLTGNQCC